jgi:O-acetylserine/cysteine efflux transporter
MKPRDTFLACLAALALGLAFIAIKLGVREAPPLALTALRFAFAAFPAILFVRPPKAVPSLVALYGLLIGVAQFGLLFLAIGQGMPVGLFAGIVLIGATRFAGASFGPFAMVIGAAFCWGLGNIVGKKASRVDMFAFVVWSSLAAPLPLLALSMIFEPGRAAPALLHPTWRLAACVAALAYGGTILGFDLWSRLLSRHPAARVAPFALLIPVVGMVAGWIVFAEPLGAFEICGAVLVLGGLSVNVFGNRGAGPSGAPALLKEM